MLDDGRIVERGTHDELLARGRALRRDVEPPARGGRGRGAAARGRRRRDAGLRRTSDRRAGGVAPRPPRADRHFAGDSDARSGRLRARRRSAPEGRAWRSSSSIFDFDPLAAGADPPRGLPVHRAFALCALFCRLVLAAALWIGLILAAWCAYFFRDPAARDADRRRSGGQPGRRPRRRRRRRACRRRELGLGEQTRRAHLDLHERVRLPREPGAGRGRVARVVYRPGKFVNAELDKASEDNERNGLVLDSAARAGRRGADRRPGRAAHRLLREGGRRAGAGERIGLIRFGSRARRLSAGRRRTSWSPWGRPAIAGETVIARFGGRPTTASVRID